MTSEAAAAVMEGRLTTPKLDISGLHGRRYDGDDKLAGELLIICITDERSRAHIDVEFFLNVSMFVACSAKINLSRNNQLMWHLQIIELLGIDIGKMAGKRIICKAVQPI